MTELADSTSLRAALGERPDDPHGAARERLRGSHLDCKERATLLAGEIARTFPHLTVHDGTHLDAVWEMVDLVAGDEIELNAFEAYILGGAILLHDLGLAVAAYPEPDTLRADPRWNDAVALVLEGRLGRHPSKREIAEADADVQQASQEVLLRRLHAERAERLALVHWVDARGEQHHLIENAELRRATGAVIGRLAHSHWWETDELARQFDGRLGPPPWCPPEWSVDLLQLACLLRTADALHLDARRAPMFLRALRCPAAGSADHWSFQERLHRPLVSGDRVEFTTGDPFPASESRAWWLYFETLRDADRWLREVDALLSDLGRTRLRVRAVSGVEHPERLAQLVPTTGWKPVDTHVHVSDVAGLVANLGGRELYGDDPTVALRELIQNGADAVRARRRLQRRPSDWGVVTVRSGTDEGVDWIEVEDVGVGMAEHVLTKALLDFGTSYWASPDLPAEFPGLLAEGFEAIGRYGIGFFSVFMLGRRVVVTTRPFRAGEAETQVLTFDGLHERPILRPASEHERLIDGGTRVRVWVDEPLETTLLAHYDETWPLERLVEWLCPALDVEVRTEGEQVDIVAPTWSTAPADDLIARVCLDAEALTYGDGFAAYVPNLRPLHDAEGALLGRMAIFPESEFEFAWAPPGVVTVGGLRATLINGVMGVLTARPTTAARNGALPTVGSEVLARWATEQASLLAAMNLRAETAADTAATVAACGGDTGALPIAETAKGWMSQDDLHAWARGRSRIVVVGDYEVWGHRQARTEFSIAPDVVSVAGDASALVRGGMGSWPLHDTVVDGVLFGSLEERVRHLVADAWGISYDELLAQADLAKDNDSRTVEYGTRDGSPIASVWIDVLHRPDAAD